MNKKLKPQQIPAMRHTERLVEEILANTKNTKEQIIETFIANPDNKNYEEIIKPFINEEEFAKMSKKTIRGIAGKILKTLVDEGNLSEDNYKTIIKKRKSSGGKQGNKESQKTQGQIPMSQEEINILETIGTTKDLEYRRGSHRKIKEIAKKIYLETGIQRSEDYIAKYMRIHFKQERKEIINRENNPDEIALLHELFQKYYSPNKKLPITEITNEVNKKFKNNRTYEAVGAYIRNHRKNK